MQLLFFNQKIQIFILNFNIHKFNKLLLLFLTKNKGIKIKMQILMSNSLNFKLFAKIINQILFFLTINHLFILKQQIISLIYILFFVHYIKQFLLNHFLI